MAIDLQMLCPACCICPMWSTGGTQLSCKIGCAWYRQSSESGCGLQNPTALNHSTFAQSSTDDAPSWLTGLTALHLYRTCTESWHASIMKNAIVDDGGSSFANEVDWLADNSRKKTVDIRKMHTWMGEKNGVGGQWEGAYHLAIILSDLHVVGGTIGLLPCLPAGSPVIGQLRPAAGA